MTRDYMERGKQRQYLGLIRVCLPAALLRVAGNRFHLYTVSVHGN